MLLTCVGRKSYLVPIFESSAHLGQLVAVDADPDAAIRYHVDHFHAAPPVVTEPEAYIERLLELARSHHVDWIIPQNDLDVIELAEARPRFRAHDIEVAGADAETVRIVEDKYQCRQWMEKHDLPYPTTWAGGELETHDGSVVVKPRYGHGSKGVEVRKEGDVSDLEGTDYVVQPELRGAEYNLDILRAPRGGVLSVVPKRKLEMRWGATHMARSVEAPELVELGVAIGEAVGHVGSIDVDVMADRSGENYQVIDINPRVGGGFPFTYHVCPRYVETLVDVCRGQSVESFLGDYESGVRIHREFEYRVVDES